MKFHPLTHVTIAAELALLGLYLPLVSSVMVIFFWLLIILFIPKRTETPLTALFLKMLAIAAFFLFLIQGLDWKPLSVSSVGLLKGMNTFVRFAAPVAFVIHVSRNIRLEELYAFLIDLKIPPSVIFIFFRTLWLVPRFVERIDEVLMALKLRGMRMETVSDRVRALIPSLNPIFSSMFEEMFENALTLAARGFLMPGLKSHVAVLSFRYNDWIALFLVNLFIWITWF